MNQQQPLHARDDVMIHNSIPTVLKHLKNLKHAVHRPTYDGVRPTTCSIQAFFPREPASPRVTRDKDWFN